MIIQHVVPLNDLKKHQLQTGIGEWGRGKPSCDCPCGTRLVPREGGCGFIVVHSAFDGRECVEKAMEAFDLPVSDDHPKWGIFNEEK